MARDAVYSQDRPLPVWAASLLGLTDDGYARTA
ncbi:hypothetical protein BJ982_006885 [Sphaerisporangium siamense]|uniref:Uncharacterized protein n=1 Tax=Sphaerisporangium siamense TaxID=795645 RepID=A0A7W7GFR4_9ACTN|nr:hypothetical protein [Sphaerisporangium siamense]